jgi:hypothetical protein
VEIRRFGYKPVTPQEVLVGKGWTATADFPLEPEDWKVTGFSSPIDMNGYLNIANAGRTIPVKWHLIDQTGAPISNPQSVEGLVTNIKQCTSGSQTAVVEEYVSISENDLIYKGNGDWQYNWKTPKAYATLCIDMHIEFVNGQTSDTAYFKFK